MATDQKFLIEPDMTKIPCDLLDFGKNVPNVTIFLNSQTS